MIQNYSLLSFLYYLLIIVNLAYTRVILVLGTDATAEIQGGGEKYVRVGSSLKLVCIMRDITQPPVYVFWYHNNLMINYRATRQVRHTLTHIHIHT